MNKGIHLAALNGPWATVRPGYDINVLRGVSDHDTRALLLRLQPGIVIPRHRHEGEVHAINIAGHRKLLDTGEVVEPGGYVYEPPGNVDSWMAVGTEPLIVFVTVQGAIDFLDDHGNVVRRTTTETVLRDYVRARQQ
jgi:2,4'-dihydroxyacetophenone dioxygenase